MLLEAPQIWRMKRYNVLETKLVYRGIGILYATSPLIMAFNVQENAVFIQEFSKISQYTVGGGHSLPTPSLCPPPPLKNPGYASVHNYCESITVN